MSTELVKRATTRRRDERDKARVRIAFRNVIPSSVMRNLDDVRCREIFAFEENDRTT